MLAPHTPLRNRLLAALPATDYERLLPNLELSPFPLGWAVYEDGGTQGFVYFPTTSIVFLTDFRQAGDSAAMAMIGNDGIIGTTMFTGGEMASSRAVVLKEGFAFRLEGSFLKDELARGSALRGLLKQYTQALIAQATRNAMCAGSHAIEQQLCRWLLLSLDRLPSDEPTVTEAFVASTLGMRRAIVTEVAGKLHAAGLLDNRRGKITVLDRWKLEARACECYEATRQATSRLFSAATL